MQKLRKVLKKFGVFKVETLVNYKRKHVSVVNFRFNAETIIEPHLAVELNF